MTCEEAKYLKEGIRICLQGKDKFSKPQCASIHETYIEVGL
jgi:hypothetical protein